MAPEPTASVATMRGNLLNLNYYFKSLYVYATCPERYPLYFDFGLGKKIDSPLLIGIFECLACTKLISEKLFIKQYLYGGMEEIAKHYIVEGSENEAAATSLKRVSEIYLGSLFRINVTKRVILKQFNHDGQKLTRESVLEFFEQQSPIKNAMSRQAFKVTWALKNIGKQPWDPRTQAILCDYLRDIWLHVEIPFRYMSIGYEEKVIWRAIRELVEDGVLKNGPITQEDTYAATAKIIDRWLYAHRLLLADIRSASSASTSLAQNKETNITDKRKCWRCGKKGHLKRDCE